MNKLEFDEDELLKESSLDQSHRSYTSLYGEGLNAEEFWEEIQVKLK